MRNPGKYNFTFAVSQFHFSDEEHLKAGQEPSDETQNIEKYNNLQ